MSESAIIGISEVCLTEIATRVAEEFVTVARDLPDDKFVRALCPSHTRAAAHFQRGT
ncbi:hypothetical protein AWB67_05930 [Caballeronia terrestris]|uniref:Uncharacterized protein n=1 Tax=Caballeronia terrestris TaxID=1226301 RepID=A0A158KLZ7_9BURK|nr:hypothetical protein AWB67_05930 [Caballeronia terrestris]